MRSFLPFSLISSFYLTTPYPWYLISPPRMGISISTIVCYFNSFEPRKTAMSSWIRPPLIEIISKSILLRLMTDVFCSLASRKFWCTWDLWAAIASESYLSLKLSYDSYSTPTSGTGCRSWRRPSLLMMSIWTMTVSMGSPALSRTFLIWPTPTYSG